MKKLKKIIRNFFIVLIICFALILTGMVYIFSVAAEAPSLDSVDVTPDGYLTKVYDDQGETILTLAGTEANRIYVSLDDIPDDLEHAFVAIEDERFYTHNGIDVKGIIRAAWIGISTGKFSQGASTITQQLIKNNVFTDRSGESSFRVKLKRKIEEQYLAMELEQVHDKDWILENYLNTINLGAGSWGVEAASMRYFNKDVSQLDLAECAVLAGITKSPTAYNPINHPEESQKRQQLVLKEMLEQGYITEPEYENAIAEDVFAEIQQNHTENNTQVFSYFEDELIKSVESDLETELGYSEEEAWNAIYRGGLTIYSTQDTNIQNICEYEINNDEHYTTDAQCAVVVTSVGDGAVKAIVGGRGSKTASLTLDRATGTLFQPGSTIKVIGEYAAAMDTGLITLGTTIDDAPTTYSDGTAINNSNGSYGGQTTIRQAIVHSVNTVALRTFQEVGMDTVLQYLEKFGIDTLTEKDEYESLALGGTSGGVTVLEMTAAYNALANDGVYCQPYFYTQVLDHDGNVLLQKDPEQHRVVSAETAELLTDAMKDVLTQGTGTSGNFDRSYTLAAKTGTTTDSRSLWMMGYSTRYTCGVWGGYDDNSAQSDTSYVKYVWRSVIRQINDENTGDFIKDANIVKATICTKCGKLAVTGLCDVSVQGDMTRTEYFAEGTQPTEKCDCHEAVRFCGVSGMRAGDYCPSDSITTKVYLKEGTSGTDDAQYSMANVTSDVCTEHPFGWDFVPDYPGENGDGSDGSDGSGGSDGGDGGSGDSGFSSWYDWLQSWR